MSNIYGDITKTIGNTPLVRINNISAGLNVDILAKIESFNPLSSVKDRVGVAMLEDAEKKGLVNKNTIIIEPTSGNTGIGLAFACAAKGYKLILVMPETMSIERTLILKVLGAEIVLTNGNLGMVGAVKKAEEMVNSTKNSFMPQQFCNPANPEIHRKTTACEIIKDTDGKVDFFVAGIGTGGTITGVGEVLKQELGSVVKIIGVEPKDSPILTKEISGQHKIQGIGAGFIPQVLNRSIIDEIVTVDDTDAGNTVRKLAKVEGILAGISAGAAMWAACKIASRPESKGKTIVVLLPDSGERYVSTWLFD